ncbi:WW domain binding protein 11-domain-containing protein [Naematelia encephala]|uniref:WW domain binding protein 11-domain-containing protein n=1 Tax=Naematelia encephala TaxID=71784 RepID=A0A1Y2BGL5_9TREE|nr:WW domain binding protein 11-domain-containing protein [Naematelia encephala]
MAKSKNANPADAYRKALKAKEVKKNKEARKQARESQTIKQDTRDIEREIKSLKDAERQKPLSAFDAERLKSLNTELAHVIKTKEAYVKAHPEARDRVFKTGAHSDRPKRDGDGDEDGEGKQDMSHLYDENGRLRDPTRSIYFDPVYNPWGVPPPGMPYRERTPEESESEEDSEDEDIVMPEGPPPGADDDDEDSDDSDDIPLPEGPPPPKQLPPPPPVPPAGPSGWGAGAPPLHLPPRPPFGVAQPMGMPPFHAQPQMPFQPQSPAQYGFRPPSHRPPRPPPNVQDPLSDAPTQTYQGYRAAKHDLPVRPSAGSSTATAESPASSSLPAKPAPSAASLASATISAAPVLRDLRKEATAFVPRGVKRKAARPTPGGVSVNAAPGRGEVDEDGDERLPGKENGGGLLGKLQGVIGDLRDSGREKEGKAGAADDDYQRFLEGLGELS